MRIETRLRKLEGHALEGETFGREFWDERLGRLSDAQLERLEALVIKMGVPEDGGRSELGALQDLLTEDEQRELRSIFAAMNAEEALQ